MVENAALGGHGYSANVSVTTIGAAAADQYGDSETTDSDKKATFNTNDILDKANAAIEGQELSALLLIKTARAVLTLQA